MSKIYLNGMASVSAQKSEILDGSKPSSYYENLLPAINENYKAIIKPMILRRMSQAVKMGLFCAKKALLTAGLNTTDAILVGTGQGCLQDTEKFMVHMLESGEGLSSPTSFIQSTHNTVAGQIAINLGCKGHNMTFTQNSVSFESALIDGMLQLEEGEVENILVGGVDEISPEFTGFQILDGQIKQKPIHNLDLFKSNTPGTISSESAAFFSMGSVSSTQTYAELVDVSITNVLEKENMQIYIEEFLKRNGLKTSDIDLIILGLNGDIRFDDYYNVLQKGIFSKCCQVGYKHLVGENNSISSYAMWLAASILKTNRIPDIVKLNSINCSEPNNILIYNQYLGKNHGLILLQKH